MENTPITRTCALLLVLCALFTMARNEVWRTPVTLWQDAVSHSPNKGRARINLANSLMVAGSYDAAIREFSNARMLTYRPEMPEFEKIRTRQFAGANVISILMHTQRFAEARKESIALWNEFPGFPAAGVAVSTFAVIDQQPDFALKVIEMTIANLPRYPWFNPGGTLYLNRGAAYHMKEDCAQANENYDLAMRVDPEITNVQLCIEEESF